MPRIHQLSNSNVYVHARNEHPPPHFHAIGPDWEVVIYIRTREVGRGWAPRVDLTEILTWAATNEAYLLQKWDEYNERDS
jgi:hypothetical protein